MKRRSLLLIIISLISFYSYSQEVCLEENIVSKIIDDLIVKKDLEYKVNKLDSTIIVYERDVKTHQQEIKIYKLNEEEYKKIVKNLETREGIVVAENKDLKNEKKKSKAKEVVEDVLQYSIIGILIFFLTKSLVN